MLRELIRAFSNLDFNEECKPVIIPQEPSGAEKKIKAFDAVLDTRKFEIGLFWQRSLFFWGFISVAFGFYGGAKKWFSNGVLPLGTASFGLICAWCWHLVNRGSKYWQENWEAKIYNYEESATGYALFKDKSNRQRKWPWSAWKYSVGKITLLLSLYITFVWLLIFLNEWVSLSAPTIIKDPRWNSLKNVIIVILTFSFLIIASFFTATSITEDDKKIEKNSDPWKKGMWWQRAWDWRKKKNPKLSFTIRLFFVIFILTFIITPLYLTWKLESIINFMLVFISPSSL